MDHFLTTFTNNLTVGISQHKQQSHEHRGKMEHACEDLVGNLLGKRPT